MKQQVTETRLMKVKRFYETLKQYPEGLNLTDFWLKGWDDHIPKVSPLSYQFVRGFLEIIEFIQSQPKLIVIHQGRGKTNNVKLEIQMVK